MSSRKWGKTLEPTEEEVYLPPNWPGGYKTIHCFLMPGISSEYQLMGWAGDSQVYFIPNSLFCSCPLLKMTKAQRGKHELWSCGGIGEEMKILVSMDPADRMAKGIVETPTKMNRRIPTKRHGFKTRIVFSPENPMRCWADELRSLVDISPRLKSTRPVPNVVYYGHVNCLYKTNELDAPYRGVPADDTIMAFELHDFERFRQMRGRIKLSEMFETLLACPWNMEHEQRDTCAKVNHFLHWVLEPPEDTDKRSPEQMQMMLRPSPPERIIRAVLLYYFGDGRVLRINRPKTLVRMTMDIEHNSDWKKRSHSRVGMPPTLQVGQHFVAECYYNEFLEGYFTDHYEVVQHFLVKRTVVSGNAIDDIGEPEFRVVLQHSMFKEFYVCDELNFVLIADPLRLLRNVDQQLHNDGFPVWIRLEKEHDRLAHFSVIGLDKGHYLIKERSERYPMINGIGLLVDLQSGRVFSEDYPQTRIFLTNAERRRTPVGHFFRFNALYWQEKKQYVVSYIRLLTPEERDPLKTFVKDDQFLFEDRFKCYIAQCARMHESNVFGPIDDPDDLVTKYTIKVCNNWPDFAIGYITINSDWRPAKNSQMMVQSLRNRKKESDCPEGAIRLEQFIESQKEQKGTDNKEEEEDWWMEGHIVEGRCRCTKDWGLLYELSQDDAVLEAIGAEMMDELIQMVRETKDECLADCSF